MWSDDACVTSQHRCRQFLTRFIFGHDQHLLSGFEGHLRGVLSDILSKSYVLFKQTPWKEYMYSNDDVYKAKTNNIPAGTFCG